jgi:hypothetical protein
MSTKTIIACRPGMKQQMEAAFAGVEVVVDDKLTKDYEFRERDLDLAEMLEAEIEKEERQDADPKNAYTFIIPLAARTSEFDDGGIFDVPFLAVRVENSASEVAVMTTIRELKPTLSGSFPDETVNVSATISALKAALRKKDINVLSISQAAGLISLDL